MRKPWTVALYLVHFPLIAGGPIVRYTEFSGQLARRTVGMAAFAYGVRRVVTGLVKLFLIADVLGAAADRIFGLPMVKTTADAAWFAAACFALEVYFRFFGYADIAIGLGRMLGSISEELPAAVHRRFPARVLAPLDATLITWLRDYLSLPIAGQDRPTPRLYANIVLGFCLVRRGTALAGRRSSAASSSALSSPSKASDSTVSSSDGLVRCATSTSSSSSLSDGCCCAPRARRWRGPSDR